MKKLTLLCLAIAPLLGTEAEVSGSPFDQIPVEVLGVVSGFSDKPSETMNVNKPTRMAALHNAALDYSEALFKGKYVPDEAMKVMRTASDDKPVANKSERQHVTQLIINNLRNPNTNIIRLSTAIPPFLAEHVTYMKPFIDGSIDAMNLNPHIAEHMKHSVGFYYESRNDTWDSSAVDHIQGKLDAMAREYRLLDEAVTEDVNLTEVKYIVIPDVGSTDVAITRRTVELDVLFAANPHFTLVVSFADNVINVRDYFCYDVMGIPPSTISSQVKKLSFTGKNLKTIGNWFLEDAKSLISVDFKGLNSVISVGNSFLSYAESLTSVDFRGLLTLQTVGDRFFHNPHSLISVNLRGLSTLHTVGNDFFDFAESLTSADFRGLLTLHTVGNDFFHCSKKLTYIFYHDEGQAEFIRDKM